MTYRQLELFPESIQSRQEREIREMKESMAKMRKSLYARNSELTKAYNEIYHQFETFKSMICKGNL